MKVNYQERIDLSVGELKIICRSKRTITRPTKNSGTLWLKAGYSPSLTDVAERLGVHRITVIDG
jgi:putative transposase